MARSRSDASKAGWETRRANEAAQFERRSAASKAGWEKRWTKAFYETDKPKLGRRGDEFIESKFGPVIGRGGEVDYEDDWPDVGDFQDEEETTPEGAQ